MKAYSLDLRTRAVAAVAAGQSHLAVARRFALGRSTVQRWVAQHTARGTLAPQPIPGRPRAIGPAEEPGLRAQVRAAPDATLAEHCTAWAQEHGVTVSLTTMHRALQRLGWPRKKSVSTPASKTR
jgi:transposase